MEGMPTLQDVRSRPEAAWLWDPARGRIVWANKAGIAYFGGEILFDLIDRPFDQDEAGVAEIRAIAANSASGVAATASLSFPSSGHDGPVDCMCYPHRLSDGRQGVLVVANPDPAGKTADSAFAQAFEAMPSAALLLDEAGRTTAANHEARTLLLEAQQGSLAALTGSGETAARLAQLLTRTATVSEVIGIESRIGARHVRLTLKRLGAVEGASPLLAVIDDVTERRRVEKQLSESASDMQPASGSSRLLPAEAEAFTQLGRVLGAAVSEAAKPATGQAAVTPKPHRRPADIPFSMLAMLDRMPDALVLARDGEVLHGNAKALALFGYKTAYELLNDEAVWAFFSQPRQTLPATTLTLANGRTVPIDGSISLVPWQNGPVRQYTLRQTNVESQPLQTTAEPAVEQITLRPPAQTPDAAEASIAAKTQPAVADSEWRAIIDTATDGIITLDRMGKIQTFSAGAEAIFGYRNAEVADQFFNSLLAPDSRKVVRDYLAALQGPGLASVFNDGREVTAIVKQGGTVPIFLTIGALQSSNSKTAFCAVVRDITQWKRTESELREAKEQAEAASRQKSEFLARISHELRTPLNAIMGFSEVIRLERFGPLGNERYRSYVNDIHVSGGLLLSLINDLLDLSKVEAGQLELNFTAVNLGETADTAIRMLQDAATSARVVVRKAMPPDLPNVVADLRSMRQVMINLLSNAIKFTDPGGQVIVSAVVSKAGELKLRIKDTGIGMSNDQMAAALEPFKRVATEGREVQGTGLGLPLTKALAEANRAVFSISSEPRKGTLVEITFPTTRVLAD
jgi:PAS domain S-box-containing protein